MSNTRTFSNPMPAMSYRREKRIEERKRADKRSSHYSKFWSDGDGNREEPIDEVYKNFFKIKNFLAQEKKVEIVQTDSSDASDEETIVERNKEVRKEVEPKEIETGELTQIDENITEESREFIGKKTHRESDLVPLPQLQELDIFEEPIGPSPIKVELKDDRRFHAGRGINRNEAELYSHYVQQGKRIPRRGEIGLSTDEIEKYESLGYVMSGSRHRKMNLVRMKKEQLVYTAEEKRALAIYNLEEQQRRERNIINEMKYMWQHKKEDFIGDDEIQKDKGGINSNK